REALGNGTSVHVSSWPAFDPALAREDRVTMVVQVDGKVRDRIEVDAGASEDACRELALASEKARRFLEGREVRQVVVRAPRLVNIVTSG
ncbi:MAG TPA: leucine--tRNA ligase, partial [Actinomycetota bacterium]|nr:leucine--tRNA ligase [Actinomycetota bacterium]